MKVKQFLKQHKVPILIGVLGLVATGTVSYYFLKKSKKDNILFKQEQMTQTPYAPARQQSVSSKNNSQYESNAQSTKQLGITYNEKFTRIINKLRPLLDASNQQITPQIIEVIIKGQYQLAVQDLKALTYKSRRQRRLNINDGLEYAKIITKYQYDLQQIQQKHLGVILARFNIDKATWKQATNAWQGQNMQGLSELISDQQKKLLLSYRTGNAKPKQFLFIQKALNFKIKKLQVLNPQNFGADLAADDASKYDMIETYINDLTFQHLHVEQQDLQYSIDLLSKAQKQKINVLDDKIKDLMLGFMQMDSQEKQSSVFY